MAKKFRVHGFPIGGAKGAIRPAPGLDDQQRSALIRRMAQQLAEPLATSWITGTDAGTTAADLADVFATLGMPQPIAVKRILKRQGWHHPLTWVPDWIFRLLGDRYSDDMDSKTGEGLWVCARTALELQCLVSCSFGLMLTRQVRLTSHAALHRATLAKLEDTLRGRHAKALEQGRSIRSTLEG
jgi:hypothetical protein